MHALIVLAALSAAPPAMLSDEQRRLAGQAATLALDALKAADAGEVGKALPLATKALEIRRQLLGERHPGVADALELLAHVRQAMADHAAARPLLERALVLRRELQGERHHKYGKSLHLLGRLHIQTGDYKTALPLLRRSLEVWRATTWHRHPDYSASCLSDLAWVYRAMGDFKTALPLYAEVVAIRKAALGPRHPAYASSLYGLASLHADMGDHAKALPLLEEAANIYKAQIGGRHPEYADVLMAMARVCRDKGEHKAALPLIRQALEIRKKAFGVRHPAYVEALHALATLHVDMGDLKAALPLLREVAVTRRMIFGQRHPSTAEAYMSLGGALVATGDAKAAVAVLESAAGIYKAVLGEKHPTYARALKNLAAAKKAAGVAADALPLFRQALLIHKEVLGERHPETLRGLRDLARLHAEMGDIEKALPLYRQALALSRETLGERHPSHAAAMHNLAALLLKSDKLAEARPLADKALEATLTQLRLDASIQSERQQVAAYAASRHALALRLSMGDDAHGHVLSWKGAAFAAQQARRHFVRSQGDAATRALADELLKSSRGLAKLTDRSKIEELTRGKEELEARLAQLSADFRLSVKPPSSKEMSAAIPKDAVLIDFLAYSGYDLAKPMKGQTLSHRLVAWVVRRDAPSVRIDLGAMSPIAEAITAWRAVPDDRDAARRVRLLLWAPLEKHLGGAKHLLVSPDGPLCALPFAALPGAKAGSYLIEESAVTLLVTPRTILEARARVKGASLLTVAGPWPAARGEAKAAADSYLPDRAVTSLDGKAATCDEVRAALLKATHAHFATGGQYTPDPPRSALDRGEVAEGIMGWHPGLQSCINLADGDLTALEVAEMDLSNLDLAVLTGCGTALGKEAAGEGVLGLPRAFHVAGCRTVVASLWAVPDDDTATLMARFHRGMWGKKLPRAEALRQAQLSLLREGKTPRSWAGWALSGEWR